MISFFPQPYPDELMYSVICRYHSRSGYASQTSSIKDIYRNISVFPSFEFVNEYTDDALSWMTKSKSFENLIFEHTQYPMYSCFFQQERKKTALEALIKQEGNWNNLLGIKRTGKRYMRYCYKCSQSDREKYGETYWHRSSQIMKMRVCPIHGCFLSNTNIAISTRQSPKLYDAESLIPFDSSTENASSIERELAAYAYTVMYSKNVCNSDVENVLHFYLDKKYLRNKNGVAWDFNYLYSDFLKFYSGIQVPEAYQIQKVLGGYIRDSYMICQIAFWEGIPFEDLISNRKIYIDLDTEIFYKELSEKYEVDFDTVFRIGKEIKSFLYERGRFHSKPGRRSYDYSKMDLELLPKVELYVNEILTKEGRPEKLSYKKVNNALDLPSKTIFKLPKCKNIIEKNLESQKEYWAREVVWAVNETRNNNENLNWKHIRKLTNIRPRDLVACLPYIEDVEIEKIIKEIINGLSSLNDNN